MRYLGIDFGLKRVGLASSEGTLAAPLKTIEVKGFKDAVGKVVGLVMSEGFNKIIVGLPEGKMGRTVLGFIKALRRAGMAVDTTDETLSSQRAIAQMIQLNIPKKVMEQISSEGFDKIVIGLPEGKMGRTVLGFIKALRRAGMDVDTTDETLSSQRAIAQMIQLNIPKNKRQTSDAYSAAIILQNYLDSSR